MDFFNSHTLEIFELTNKIGGDTKTGQSHSMN